MEKEEILIKMKAEILLKNIKPMQRQILDEIIECFEFDNLDKLDNYLRQMTNLEKKRIAYIQVIKELLK